MDDAARMKFSPRRRVFRTFEIEGRSLGLMRQP